MAVLGTNFLLICCVSLVYFSTVDALSPEKKPAKCPGMYCGRISENSECGACPRGFRPDGNSMCEKCVGTPTFYDKLYLGFMAMLSLVLHWFFVDFTNKRKGGGLIILHLSALIESVTAAVCTLLVIEPVGRLAIMSCPVVGLSDWYTMLYNPNPGYTTTLHCTQEAVYPLYTIVMVYYAFSLLFMMIFRPLFSARIAEGRGAKSIYAALYFFPILVVIQAVLGGLIYYSFPYILLVVTVVTSAIHFAYFQEQSVTYLFRENFQNPRNLTILVGHWVLHAYGIISVTELRNPSFHWPMIALVPFPALFYLVTVKFTDPNKLEEV